MSSNDLLSPGSIHTRVFMEGYTTTEAWFPLDRDGIVKSCNLNWFQLVVERLIN